MTNKEWQECIIDIDKSDIDLSSWECKFIGDLVDKIHLYKNEFRITDRQKEIVNQIWEKVNLHIGCITKIREL